MKSMGEIVEELEKELRLYKIIALVSIVLNCILTVFVIGEYILPWGYF